MVGAVHCLFRDNFFCFMYFLLCVVVGVVDGVIFA